MPAPSARIRRDRRVVDAERIPDRCGVVAARALTLDRLYRLHDVPPRFPGRRISRDQLISSLYRLASCGRSEGVVSRGDEVRFVYEQNIETRFGRVALAATRWCGQIGSAHLLA